MGARTRCPYLKMGPVRNVDILQLKLFAYHRNNICFAAAVMKGILHPRIFVEFWQVPSERVHELINYYRDTRVFEQFFLFFIILLTNWSTFRFLLSYFCIIDVQQKVQNSIVGSSFPTGKLTSYKVCPVLLMQKNTKQSISKLYPQVEFYFNCSKYNFHVYFRTT